MRVVEGRAVRRMDEADVIELARAAERVVVDVGTGDGRFAWRLAREHPEWLVVGVDPARERLTDTARRAARRSDRGGAPNLLLVWAAIEDDLPPLTGRADEVVVLAPWGRLLAGVVGRDDQVLRGLRRVARGAGSSLVVTLGTRLWAEPVTVSVRNLPNPLVDDDGRAGLEAGYARCGWSLDGVEEVAVEDLRAWSSSWSRRLGDRPDERFVVLRATAV